MKDFRHKHRRSPALPRALRKSQRRGGLLLVVLIIVAMLTIANMSYFDWTFTEFRATQTSSRGVQARLASESGIDFIKVYTDQSQNTLRADGGLYTNSNRFKGVLLADSDAAALRLRFSVVAPDMVDGRYSGVRFGLENESSKLNLNILPLMDEQTQGGGRALLMALPGMTESIADAILDFIDEDDEPRAAGAERDYYSSISPAYEPMNGPLETLDQLLLVRDVTPELLYGLDQNRNFSVDGSETGVVIADVDNSLGEINRGWSAYLTLFSAEANKRPDGSDKIDLNGEDLEALHDELEEVFGLGPANFIIAFRQGGPEEAPTEETEGSQPEEVGTVGEQSSTSVTKQAEEIQIDYEQPGSVTISSLLDLVGVESRLVELGQTDRTTVAAAFPNEPGTLAELLPLLYENCAVSAEPSRPGRLNINQAPRLLLESFPNMPPGVAEQIISNRDFEVTADRPGRQYESWLLTESIVTLEDMKKLAPFITGGGDVYRAQVLGFYDDEGPIARWEAVIEATGDTPQLLESRELTPLGAGFTPALLGATTDAPR